MEKFKRLNKGRTKNFDENCNFCRPEYWDGKLTTILDNVDVVINRLRATFPDSFLMFVGIVPDPEWCYESKIMADNIEWHLKQKHNVKIAPLAGLVDRHVHIDDDGVHFTHEEYRLLMDKVLTRVLDRWFAPLMHDNVAPA